MKLDKELYRKAYESYRQWNETESIERIREAGKLTPQQSWNRYVALWELLVKIAPEISEHQHQQRLVELEQYNRNIQKLEDWKRLRGETA
jgi:hypothetical protein